MTSGALGPGYPFVVLDGTFIPVDGLAAGRPVLFRQTPQARDEPAGHLQPRRPSRVSVRPTARLGLRLEGRSDLGHHRRAGRRRVNHPRRQGPTGAGDPVITPYRGRNKPASQKEANRADTRLRAPGERADAQLKNWRILCKLRCCPWRARQIAKPSTSFRPAKPRMKRLMVGSPQRVLWGNRSTPNWTFCTWWLGEGDSAFATQNRQGGCG